MDKEEYCRSDPARPLPLPPARAWADPHHPPPPPPRGSLSGDSAPLEVEPDGSDRVEPGAAITTKDFSWIGDQEAQPATTPRPEEVEFELARLKPEEPGERIGPYKLLQQLGEGGFGVVWLAEQEQPVRRRVALKIIKMGMDTREVVARFEQERQALAMMDHPNIAKVFDAGATPFGRPYFVMELVRGIRITEYCDQLNLDTEQRLQLFIVLCRAVQHAHLKGIIHRDLKPSNILVAVHDAVPVPMIIDFGVAKATQHRLTELTLFTEIEQMVGTPVYMSPEQAEMSRLDIDSRTDVYALGVLLYELLTGRTPFDPTELMKKSRDEIRRVIREQEPLRPSLALGCLGAGAIDTVAMHRRIESGRLLSLLRGDLDWIVMKAIEKDRTRRYETANDLAADIERHLSHEPIRARPPSRLYRLRRFIRRHRVGFYSGLFIAAALIIGTSVSVSQAVRAEREAKRANDALADLGSLAPALEAQAREYVLNNNFRQAIETLDTLIRIRPKEIRFHIGRGSLLKVQFRFKEAAEDYRRILELDSGHKGAAANLALCLRLAGVTPGGTGGLPTAALAEVYASLEAEGRPPPELMPLAHALGKENEIMLAYWLERLRSLPNASAIPLKGRLKSGEAGLLELDLRGTKISDLSPLTGMPLRSLDLSGCTDVVDLKALSNMPLRVLNAEKTGVTSVEPVGTMREIEELNIARTSVTDIASLSGLHIRKLILAHTRISDLKSVRDLPLQHLDVASTRVSNLEPLKRMPLKILDCSSARVDDYSPLSALPLEQLYLDDTAVGDLGFVRRMPLQVLVLGGATGIRGIGTLAEIPTLETLVLPGNPLRLYADEIDAIASLRNKPGLLRISATPAAVFWRKWDSMMKWWKPLRAAGIKVEAQQLPDETWSVIIRQQPIRDLSIFSGSEISRLELTGCEQVSDLEPLKDLPLTFLGIVNTGVKDLKPLQGMELKDLWMAGTKVSDLEPLRGMPLRLLHFDQCPRPLDVSPLAESRDLTSVILPESALNVEKLRQLKNLRRISYSFDIMVAGPTTSAPEFWKEFHDLRWLHDLRAAGLKPIAEQLSDGTWRVVITDTSFSDTQALEGAHISELVLRGSNVTDVQPLADLKLRRLRLDGTPCTQVSPLAAIASLVSLILPQGATDFRSLQSSRNIKRIAFKPNALGLPEFEVEEFWRRAADDVR